MSASHIASNFPEIAARVSVGNNEADPLGGWNKVKDWQVPDQSLLQLTMG